MHEHARPDGVRAAAAVRGDAAVQERPGRRVLLLIDEGTLSAPRFRRHRAALGTLEDDAPT